MKNEIVKFDTPELQVIEKSKAEQIKTTFEPMAKMLDEFEERYNELMSIPPEEMTVKLTKEYKRLRIDIGQVRIDTGKAKDKAKEYIKLEDKAIMGVHNILVWAVKEKEDKLKEREKFFEIQEQKRLEALQIERAKKLSLYIEDASERDLSKFREDEFEALLSMKKKEQEDKIAAEEKAEADRKEKERKEKVYYERLKIIAPYSNFNPSFELLMDTPEEKFQELLKDLTSQKKDYDIEQEKIRKDNERLKAEAAERDKLAKIEADKRAKLEAELEAELKAKLKRKTDIRRVNATQFLLDNGFESTHGGMRAIGYNHFIGSLHYSEFATDNEFEAFKTDILKTKEIEQVKAKQKALEAELKAKKEEERLAGVAAKEAEAKAKAEAEAKLQAELNKGDAEKVADLIIDLESLKIKYIFESEKNTKMYSDVNTLLGKIINHIKG